jgi:hypothetical protein
MNKQLKQGEVSTQVSGWFPSSNFVTAGSTISPYGLQLRQTLLSTGNVKIPDGINWVYAIVVGGGGGGGTSTTNGGGAGGVAWGWTVASSSCIVASGNFLNIPGGFSRYGSIIAGGGGAGAGVAEGTVGFLGSGGGLREGSTNYWGTPLAGGGPGGYVSTVGATPTAGGSGVSGGGGGGFNVASGNITGGTGGSGLAGGGGGGGAVASGTATGGNGGNGINILTGAKTIGGLGRPTVGSGIGVGGGGGAGVAGNGSNATSATGAAGGLGGGGGGGRGGPGGNGLIYLFY